jgi:hypothetical protein
MRAKRQTAVSTCSLSLTFLLILSGNHWSQMCAVFVNIFLLCEVKGREFWERKCRHSVVA